MFLKVWLDIILCSGDRCLTSLLSFRMASITNILGRFRNEATTVQGVTNSAGYRLSSSINPSMAYYYFKVGSQIEPSFPG